MLLVKLVQGYQSHFHAQTEQRERQTNVLQYNRAKDLKLGCTHNIYKEMNRGTPSKYSWGIKGEITSARPLVQKVLQKPTVLFPDKVNKIIKIPLKQLPRFLIPILILFDSKKGNKYTFYYLYQMEEKLCLQVCFIFKGLI